jgi:methionine gamma-lyase
VSNFQDFKKIKGFQTKSIHEGYVDENPYNSLNPPIFMTSSFSFQSVEEADEIFRGEREGFVYTRGRNPSTELFEKKVAVLEGGVDAVAFSSGMGAISATVLSFVKQGDHVVAGKFLYGSCYGFMKHFLSRYGITVSFVDTRDLKQVEDAITDKTKLIYLETPSNPSLYITNIREVCNLANKKEIPVVVDNTFATPYWQKPLLLGAKVVVHSATKFLSGHGDVVAGVAVSKDQEYINKLRYGFMCELGSPLSPFNSWLLLRGMKTLGIRMEKHAENAMLLATYLQDHEKVEHVWYPGLSDHEGYETANEQMMGYGAIISFTVKGGAEKAKELLTKFKMCKLAVSLGDAETLVEHPASMTHRDYDKESLEEFGLSDNMVRIAVGLEDSKDIILDFYEAFEQI